jgi:hypothetical protein
MDGRLGPALPQGAPAHGAVVLRGLAWLQEKHQGRPAQAAFSCQLYPRLAKSILFNLRCDGRRTEGVLTGRQVIQNITVGVAWKLANPTFTNFQYSFSAKTL